MSSNEEPKINFKGLSDFAKSAFEGIGTDLKPSEPAQVARSEDRDGKGEKGKAEPVLKPSTADPEPVRPSLGDRFKAAKLAPPSPFDRDR